MSPLSAIPSAQNDVAPTATVTAISPARDHGTDTPYTSAPIATTSTSINRLTTIALPTRPAMNAHGGRGVPRPRLRIPSSRAIVTLIARFTIVAETSASVRIAGT